ncbi:Uncharacterized protein BP5553_08441 [Venustampulla echinocandica]|uniref:Uncharacterized protein n=1 Tax=Venustampulla echinocandica TaxID=2656787 RepID=A0A370TE79_9HELO|nr:Uncharacterized protein BP5553_08441 [Venustampulla echinocandica]RDL33002.1 Uncharacterized protein BP5553_08441 [Venustampulla echinocandica]
MSATASKEHAWDQILRKHRKSYAGRKHASSLEGVPDYLSLEDTLEQLQQEYNSKLVARCIVKLKPAFQQLETFQASITSIAQVHEGSMVVWGVLQMLLSSACRYLKTLENFTQLLHDLTSTVTRLNRYLFLLPSSDILKDITKSVHEEYVDCCVTALNFYGNRPIFNLLRNLWSDVNKKFENIRHSIEAHIITFEREARVDIDEELVGHVRKNPRKDSPSTIFSVPFSENEYFCGRDDVLSEIHRCLSPDEKKGQTRQRSYLIYAMGGMGKTQVALAYAYRNRSTYPFVFWIGAQKEPDLGVTFSSIAMILGMPNIDDLGQGRKVNLVREWLETTDKKWLLIFDNVESIESVQPYWPSSSLGGAILVTSQIAGLAQSIRSHIALEPLTSEVASTLLLDLLQIKSPTKEMRESVSKIAGLVGGLPIAIAHIAGSMFLSQLTIDEAIEMFDKQRLQTIWSTDGIVSTHMYDQRLHMVWDIALSELSEDALHLLDILALLSPDTIYESMLMGVEDAPTFTGKFSDTFPEIRLNLNKRQLVQRNTATSEPYLSLHRSFQISLRNNLSNNPDKYDKVFQETIHLVRRVFPVMNMTMKCENEKWVEYEKYQPHVQTLQSIAQNSPYGVGKIPEFAQLLGYAGNYYWERGLVAIGIETCKFAVSVWEAIPDAYLIDYSQPLTLWGLMELEMGITQRQIGMDCFIKCLELRTTYLAQAENGGTKDEQLLHCNAWSDYSIALIEFGYYAEAETFITLTLALKSRHVTESSYPMMFGISYGHLASVYSGLGNHEKAKAFSARSVKLVQEEYIFHSASMQKWYFFQANIWLGAGDLEEALEAHLSILEVRIKIFGTSGPHTRYSYYALGATYHALGNMDEAEKMLRSSLEDLELNPWLEDAVARSRFLLSRVLLEKHRSLEKHHFSEKLHFSEKHHSSEKLHFSEKHHSSEKLQDMKNEVSQLAKLAKDHLNSVLPNAAQVFGGTVKDEIVFYEYIVPVQCGRTMLSYKNVKSPKPSQLLEVPAKYVPLLKQRPESYGMDGDQMVSTLQDLQVGPASKAG